MRLLSTLYVMGHRAKVSVAKRNLQVQDPERGRTRVPLESVDAVVLLGQAQVTSQALGICVKTGIPVTSLTRGGRIRFSVRGGTSGNVHLRLGQLRTADSEEARLSLARWFVAGKLQNSRRLMLRWARDLPEPRCGAMVNGAEEIKAKLGRLERAETIDLIRGLEGDGGRAYFRAMGTALASTEMPFQSRTRRPPRDPVNALLGFSGSSS